MCHYGAYGKLYKAWKKLSGKKMCCIIGTSFLIEGTIMFIYFSKRHVAVEVNRVQTGHERSKVKEK